jgi:hypothetical protein
MAIVSERTQVMDVNVYQFGFARAPHNPVIERPRKKIWENGNDIDLHGTHSVSKQEVRNYHQQNGTPAAEAM